MRFLFFFFEVFYSPRNLSGGVPRPNDSFGSSLDLSNDGNMLAVGSYGDSSGVGGNFSDNSSPNSGAVFVFIRTNNMWALQA